MKLHSDELCTLYLGDCVEVMHELPAESVDAIVTDPPYGLEFMGKAWDALSSKGRGARVREKRAAEMTPTGQGHTSSKGPYLAAGVDWQGARQPQMQAWHEAWASEAFRVAKPGAHLLAFGGTRTYHRLASAIEDAGWEIRDCLVWAYASGFPKSLDVSKAIDKAAGAEREVTGTRRVSKELPNDVPFGQGLVLGEAHSFDIDITAPATPAAVRWNGWGTALKPAWEPIVMARKPLRGTVAANVTAWGTGALNIDATRIGYESTSDYEAAAAFQELRKGHPGGSPVIGMTAPPADSEQNRSGRWPANLLLTATEWYTLRHDVGQEVRDLIYAYLAAQGMGADELPDMRQGVRYHASMGAGGTPEVLLSAVQLEGFVDGQADGSTPSARVDTAHEGRGDGAVHRPELAGLEGRTLVRPERIRERGGLDAGGAGAGTGRGDGSETREGQALHSGASPTDGRDAGSATGVVRGGPSPERDQGRQPTGQSIPAGPIESHAGTPDGGSGVGPVTGSRGGARGRERGLTVPLALIPPGWLRYFEFSHDSGIFDGDTPGVVGGGATTPLPGRGIGQYPAAGADSVFADMGGMGTQYGDSGTYSRFFLIPKSSRSDREPLTRDEAYRLHRESGACDKLPAWRRQDLSPGEPTDSTSPARATSARPSTDARHSDTSSPGSRSTDQSPAVISSTISTATSRTTRSRTSSSSTLSPTSASIPAASFDPGNGGSPAPSADDSSLWGTPTGTSPEKDGPSTDGADPATSKGSYRTGGCADCGKPLPRVSSHPTVKPIDLMRHLVRLVTPPGGTVLDCFLGSGTTAIAANAEGFRCIGIEKEREYLDIALARMAHQPLGMQL